MTDGQFVFLCCVFGVLALIVAALGIRITMLNKRIEDAERRSRNLDRDTASAIMLQHKRLQHLELLSSNDRRGISPAPSPFSTSGLGDLGGAVGDVPAVGVRRNKPRFHGEERRKK